MRQLWVLLFRRSRLGYYADFLITPPITLVVLVMSIQHSETWMFLVLFPIGLLLWTVYEYALHRWLLHGVPLLRELHDLHHEDQLDYIAVHPLVTLGLYFLLWYLLGFGTSPIMAGFSVGYVVYSVMHTMFHYARIVPGHPLYRLRRLHAVHHRVDANYGVTSPLWDVLLDTTATPRRRAHRRGGTHRGHT